jgi:hypothetical protein
MSIDVLDALGASYTTLGQRFPKATPSNPFTWSARGDDKIDIIILDLIISYVIDRVSPIFDRALQRLPRGVISNWHRPPVAEY